MNPALVSKIVAHPAFKDVMVVIGNVAFYGLFAVFTGTSVVNSIHAIRTREERTDLLTEMHGKLDAVADFIEAKPVEEPAT